MKYKPHEYQRYATEFIVTHLVCGLLLDCGLGKTVITLSALYDLLLDYFDVGRVLIIAPIRVAKDTWPAEISKWDHLKGLTYSVVVGTAAERRMALQRRAFIYIINRENVSWLIDNGMFDFDMIVIDELSSFKNHKAKRFKSLRKARSTVKRVVGLTGTPASNGLMDLWAEIGLLDKGERLGRFIGAFRDKYFDPDKRSRDIIFSYKPKEGAEQQIYEKVSDICISMKAGDHIKMPDRIDSVVEVQMDEAEKDMYEKLKAELILSFPDGDIDAKSAVGLSNKLLQMANGAAYDENGKTKVIHEKKLDALEDIIEAANGKSVLVAYWYQHDKERLMKRFNCRCIDTEDDIRDWNAGKIPVALIHPASAGHGLNLQNGGSHLVWFSITWSLELYQQCNARIYRQGQENTVTVQHLITKDTLDEDVMKALENKDATQESLLTAVKARI
ncbi:SNF2-related protein [Butyrivibrio sp. FC2001]|uniref:SNF2-related protein n=1 Tax=Butyrivibrio sp. FC2001 TaxID=1280671 RepID=UPI00041DB249|nr:DEAD/DEAH box helicase [Butyrivibrio sp. FC2001]